MEKRTSRTAPESGRQLEGVSSHGVGGDAAKVTGKNLVQRLLFYEFLFH